MFRQRYLTRLILKYTYIKKHWKLGIHLLLHTKKFGVNNDWWFRGISIFGPVSSWKILTNLILVYPIIRNYKAMKNRAIYLGFMHPDKVRLLWGKHPWFDD